MFGQSSMFVQQYIVNHSSTHSLKEQPLRLVECVLNNRVKRSSEAIYELINSDVRLRKYIIWGDIFDGLNICRWWLTEFMRKYLLTIKHIFKSHYALLLVIGELNDFICNAVELVLGFVGIYIYRYLPYVHILETTWKILRTQLKKDIVILEIARKLAMDTLDSEMVVNEEENHCRFEKENWICLW